MRLYWRLAFAVVCPQHGVELTDRCGQCQAPVRHFVSSNVTACWKCGENLAHSATAAAREGLVSHQRQLYFAAERGWGFMGRQAIGSLPLFDITRQLAVLCFRGKRSHRLRTVLAHRYGINPEPYEPTAQRAPFEYLPHSERLRLFDSVARLIEAWPVNMWVLCEDAELYRSFAIVDMPTIPYLFQEAIRPLDRTPYKATEDEVAAAAAWLRKTEGAASYGKLRELCGESRLALYRNKDILRQSSKTSRFQTLVNREGPAT
jgi:hypothetical protein